jgi:hypothetical protein
LGNAYTPRYPLHENFALNFEDADNGDDSKDMPNSDATDELTEKMKLKL